MAHKAASATRAGKWATEKEGRVRRSTHEQSNCEGSVPGYGKVAAIEQAVIKSQPAMQHGLL